MPCLPAQRSLPHRQLRKHALVVLVAVVGSLPHRQLRKDIVDWEPIDRGSLPHRQLRNGVIVICLYM